MLLVSEMDLTMCTDLRSRFLQLGNQLLRGIVSTTYILCLSLLQGEI